VILQLDVGNTRTKWRLIGDDSVVERGVVASTQLLQLDLPLSIPDSPSQVQISSVAGAAVEGELAQRVQERWGCTAWFARSSAQACGMNNSYAQPERMGVDRWLAMIAAWRDAASDVCVIDAGSALTIDFVDAGGQHRGGFILPGLASMERALLSDTDRVRFGQAPADSLAPGLSTEEAVFHGLMLSQAGAVNLALQQYPDKPGLYFSGGNGQRLYQLLDIGGILREDLVLDGLSLLAAEEAVGAA
jgi:type III pantothenate kinase